jgi:hypothetical protein
MERIATLCKESRPCFCGKDAILIDPIRSVPISRLAEAAEGHSSMEDLGLSDFEKSRAQLYDATPNLTADRLPSKDPKAFGMLNRFSSESRDRYISPSERDRFTPTVRIDDGSGPVLTRPDGQSAAVNQASYVVIPDASQPGNERLLVNFGDVRMKHSELAAGAPVKYAGTMTRDENGKITEVDSNTGHYRLPHPMYSRYVVWDDKSLSPEEVDTKLDQADHRSASFKKFMSDKFRPFVKDVDPNSRPATPPLRLNPAR